MPAFSLPGYSHKTPLKKQHGAVLYIAVIMLIILSLLGIAGMRATGLQERMASGYRAGNNAFQNAEGLARRTECGLAKSINRENADTECAPYTEGAIENCNTPFDSAAWVRNLPSKTTQSVHVRSIGSCISANTSNSLGKAPVNEDITTVYQITAYTTDSSNATADAAVDTIIRP